MSPENLNITENQVISYLNQLPKDKRISLFRKYEDDFFSYLFSLEIDKYTEEQYNEKLQLSEEDIKYGRVKSHEEFEKDVNEWMKK